LPGYGFLVAKIITKCINNDYYFVSFTKHIKKMQSLEVNTKQYKCLDLKFLVTNRKEYDKAIS